MIGVVDYEAGNVRSVSNALMAIGAGHAVTSIPEELAACDGIILPGVGAAPGAMASLSGHGLITFLKTYPGPLLGICLGMQILFGYSEEGDTGCLGILDGRVMRFEQGKAAKVPHMGWNDVRWTDADSPLAAGLAANDYFYFAHSYYAPSGPMTRALTSDGTEFSSVVSQGNVYGVQFHPEKSGNAGMTVLKNFIGLCRSFRR